MALAGGEAQEQGDEKTDAKAGPKTRRSQRSMHHGSHSHSVGNRDLDGLLFAWLR